MFAFLLFEFTVLLLANEYSVYVFVPDAGSVTEDGHEDGPLESPPPEYCWLSVYV